MMRGQQRSLKDLYDQAYLPGVSPETRTAIINTIGFDIESLTEGEEGKFSQQELCTGLRYLLYTNPELHHYMETHASKDEKIDFLILFTCLMEQIG